jgi:protein TonB
VPRQLFDDSLAGRRSSPRSRWTVLVSTLAHFVILTVAIIVPLMATGALPDIHMQLTAFMPADIELPAPPPAGSPRRASVRSTAPPTQAPSAIDLTAEPAIDPGHESIGDVGLDVGPVGAADGVPGMIAPSAPGLIAPPPPPPAKPVPVGGAIRAPQRIASAPPVYPAIAQSARVEGEVILQAIIDADGAVRDVHVLRSIPLLDQAAIDAVRRWRYKPTLLNGIPVPVIMTVTVSFRLQ